MLTAEGRDSISRAGRLNPDKCARKLNCPVVLNKNTSGGCRLRSNFRQDLANPFGNHVGESERRRGKRYRAFPPVRGRMDMDCETREKRKEKRERSDLGKVLCAIHVRPFSPFSLIETSLLSAKRSQLSAWMAPDQKLAPSLSLPQPAAVFFSHSNFLRWGNPRLHSGREGGGPGRAEEGIFPTEKRDRTLEPDYS